MAETKLLKTWGWTPTVLELDSLRDELRSHMTSSLTFASLILSSIMLMTSAGVLQNYLGTHEQVAEFFNTVSSNLESNFHAYKDVRVKIPKHLKSHYNSRLKKWITQCLHTYFGNPWTIIAWVVATLALFFTAVQTYFAVFRP